MKHFTVTYSQEIIANSAEEAAIKAMAYLVDDFRNPYSEFIITTTTNQSTVIEDYKFQIAPSKQTHIIAIDHRDGHVKTYAVTNEMDNLK